MPSSKSFESSFLKIRSCDDTMDKEVLDQYQQMIRSSIKWKSKFQTYMLTLSVFTSQCTWCIGHCFLLLLIAFFSTIRWFYINYIKETYQWLDILLSFELVSHIGSAWTQRELSPLYHLLVVKGDYFREVFNTRPQNPRSSVTAVVPRWLFLPAQWTAAWMQFFAIAKWLFNICV